MAYIAKYKAPSVGHMLAHYRRDRSSLERDNIDPERIKNDLVVGHYTNKDGKLVVGRVEPREGEPNWGTVESRIRAGVAGIRIKVEELRSRISRPLEYLMRREQPRQQSLNDVLRDAQRAADAWNRDHAAPQRTYRGRAR